MKNIKINGFIVGIFTMFVSLCFLQVQMNAQTPVKGPSVTKVEIGNSGVEGRFVQSGPKALNHFHSDGRLFVSYTETGRDEWSVYLTSPTFSRVIIDLWKKTFVMNKGNALFY